MFSFMLNGNSRALTTLMESAISIPNRPDLRCATRVASRNGADISPAKTSDPKARKRRI